MDALNRRARVFLGLVCLAGMGAALAATGWASSAEGSGWELGLFLVLGLLAGRTKVRLTPRRTAETVGSLSLSFVLVFATLLRLGPGPAMLVGCFSTLSTCLYPKRQPLHQIAFNLGLNALATYAAGSVLVGLNHGLREDMIFRLFGSVMVSCLAFFLINSLGVSIILGLTTRRPTLTVWRETFRWTAPSYFAAGSAGAIAGILFGPNFGTVVLFAAPVAGLTYLVSILSRRHAEETQQRIAELQAHEAQLADALRHEHLIAETLQRSLLSAPDAQAFPGLDVHTEYEPAWAEALIGGDFYDTVPLPGGQIALVIGDVAGKGLRAATHTAEVKYVLRAILHECPDPGAALTRLNNYLIQSQQSRPENTLPLVAVALAVVDARTGEMTVSLAGAEPPLLLRPNGEAEELKAGGTLLGVTEGEVYEVRRLRLNSGDSLVMVTDGITEARRGTEFFGTSGLQQAIQRVLHPAAQSTEQPMPVGKAIIAEAKRFTGGQLHDDVCLLLVRRAAPSPLLPAPLVYSAGEWAAEDAVSRETAGLADLEATGYR